MNFKLVYVSIILLPSIGLTQDSQCMQSKPNSLLSCQAILSFFKDLDKAEEILLSYDFCFDGTVTNQDGDVTYYRYRIDHTLNSNTQKYDFDIFAVTKDINRIEYSTNSNKNYINYKNKLISFGFKAIADGHYRKITPSHTYVFITDRKVHSSGTPNYYIFLIKY